MKLYCDMNVYNRCFDDQSQIRIRLETAAIEAIFALAEGRNLTLVWSFMLEYENSLNPHGDRREGVGLLSRLCSETVKPSPAIMALGRRIVKGSKLKPRDALHLACADNGRCDYLVTCDDGLVKIFHRKRSALKLNIKAVNPVEFIRREGEKYGKS